MPEMRMDFRNVTPPTDLDAAAYDDMRCPGGSASTNASYVPTGWSPETVMTAATTPPRSPMVIRESGSRLLPRLRDQDQVIEPNSRLSSIQGHGRTSSLPSNVFSMQFGPALPQGSEHDRRSTSPRRGPEILPSVLTPAPSPYEYPAGSPWPSMPNARSTSASHISNVRSHSRNISSSSIDAAMLSRYGYPTYRQSPTPAPTCVGSSSLSRTPSALSHLAPIALPGGQVQNYPNNRRTTSPPAKPSRLSIEVEARPDCGPELETSTVLDYLSGPNPTPSLIQRISDPNKLQNSHFWFDIRNLRSWSDFNVETMSSIPGLLELLRVNVSASLLPKPAKVNLNPETPAQLAELCAAHHAVKVNAALRVAQGEKHIVMRQLRANAPGTRPQPPEFVANYQSDAEQTIYGDGRGRVVGIVKSYDQWNSGHRNGSPIDKIRYLEHLAHLHRCMREHGTRYGFLMTEIELVCVRMGGPPSEHSAVPLFGYLELAPPVQISASSATSSSSPPGPGAPKMTAGLALWYLHMLAKEQPFPGQFSWRVDVGGPAARSRSVHLPARDDWMPRVNLQDKRISKRVRGWVWPDEPLHKRECTRVGKRRGR